MAGGLRDLSILFLGPCFYSRNVTLSGSEKKNNPLNTTSNQLDGHTAKDLKTSIKSVENKKSQKKIFVPKSLELWLSNIGRVL